MGIAVVTGSSTGIGFATSEALARAGHDVIATMRSPDRAPALADLARRDSLPITVMRMDVDSDTSVSATIGEVLAARGRIDVLVNNAGLGHLGSVEETPLSTFRQVMETNYFGALRCIQAVVPGMRARKSGLIVNVTSVAGRLASPAQSSYCASKFALEALSESLAAEVKADGIRVAIVEPGVVATPIFGKETIDRRQHVSARASADGAVQRVARAPGSRVCRRRSHPRHRRERSLDAAVSRRP